MTRSATACQRFSFTLGANSHSPPKQILIDLVRSKSVLAYEHDSRRGDTMKGNDEVVRLLNRVLYNELIAINQYFLHSRMLRNWGITKLAEYEYKESLDEMRHADELIERILFLDGLPNLQDLGKLLIGEDVEEILRCDLKLEHDSLPTLREGIAACEKHGDYNSRQLLAKILHGEEEHIDWLEAQFEMIKRMRLENYVQLQSAAAKD
jgi:bacterioferritin